MHTENVARGGGEGGGECPPLATLKCSHVDTIHSKSNSLCGLVVLYIYIYKLHRNPLMMCGLWDVHISFFPTH